MTFSTTWLTRGLCVALVLVMAQAFAPAPATAQLFDAAAMGRQEHPKILKQFGGEYHDPAVREYVRNIGDRLVRHTNQPNGKFTFTVLNSDIVNAFALPGGYVYITRGLLALADSEAELASVLSHEIGHVTAGHGETRMTNTLLAQLGLGLLGSMVDSQMLNNLLQFGALAVLQSYSREQEFEADTLGVRVMTAAGYDPQASARFLAKLKAEQELRATVAGKSPDGVDQFNILATHPRTTDRVARAIRQAGTQVPPVPNPRVGIADYMRAIDGMYYDGDPENGFIKGRRFVHPALRFSFRVPPGFSILNNADSVMAVGPGNAQIVFDLARRPGGGLVNYVRDVWGRKLSLSAVEPISVNGVDAATGAGRLNTQQGPMDVRLVALAYDRDKVARFLFVTPPNQTDAHSTEFRRTTYSYRRLSREQATEQPLRLHTVKVRRGQTVARFARGMPFPSHRTERFRVLNGLGPNEKIRPGWWVKYVAE